MARASGTRAVPRLMAGAETARTTAQVVQMPGTEAARLAATGVLLKRPTYQGLEHHDVVYALRGGEVGSCPLARYRLPEPLRGSVAVIPASTDADGLSMLPTLAAILDRIAPWLGAHIVPDVIRRVTDGNAEFGRASGSYDVDGASYKGVGGFAPDCADLVFIRSGSPVWTTYTMCHEVMHKLWRKVLSNEAKEVLTTAVEGGTAWPGGYFGDTEERVCRAFEAYCWARLEREGPTPTGPRMPINAALAMDSMFAWIWEGTFADLAIGNGWVDVSDETMAARGVVIPAPITSRTPPPAPPSFEVVVGRTIRDAALRFWRWTAPEKATAQGVL